jgi:hypothetical protein
MSEQTRAEVEKLVRLYRRGVLSRDEAIECIVKLGVTDAELAKICDEDL